MNLIVVAAYGKGGVIGKDGGLPWSIPEDLRAFKKMTLGETVLMGSSTYRSLPHSKLPGRTLVVATTKGFEALGEVDSSRTTLVSDLTVDALSRSTSSDNLLVIGGAQIFEWAVKYANVLVLTEIAGDYTGDTYFPTLKKKDWILQGSVDLSARATCKVYIRKFSNCETLAMSLLDKIK